MKERRKGENKSRKEKRNAVKQKEEKGEKEGRKEK
jgi:hypothetical protein